MKSRPSFICVKEDLPNLSSKNIAGRIDMFIKGVATGFDYHGKLKVRIDKASYDQLFDQFRCYLCRNFNRPPPCLFRTDHHGVRQYFIHLTLNKLDRKEDFKTLLGERVTVRYKLRAYKVKSTSGLVAQLIDYA